MWRGITVVCSVQMQFHQSVCPIQTWLIVVVCTSSHVDLLQQVSKDVTLDGVFATYLVDRRRCTAVAGGEVKWWWQLALLVNSAYNVGPSHVRPSSALAVHVSASAPGPCARYAWRSASNVGL
eukprot:TRINITY_DN38625_c0_g1_i1.p1 TRINITY_DN38625_c0_g1~~TRINITY_DN38625_c0_g1_i1.p1  ORF type:complete len:123 (-),score=14.63 TRINITY_DN38625_c0_g1_i1:85-453(-)